ncbi:radical SAM protein [Candidatus Pelagibacter sp.]|nr:radical SAM protein [Candidatus Pelagibacter sp.]
MNNFSAFLNHFSSYYFSQKVKHLILHVTNHCNFRCAHCFVDFVNPKKDLSFKDYEIIAKDINDLFWLDIGGGEPFLRKDLYKIVNLFKKQIVSIPTNGWLKKNICDQINQMNHKDTEIVINLSLDGLEKTHNIVRKNEHSWDKVWEAYEELRKISFIKVRFITVVHEDNYDEIIPLMKIVKNRGANFHSVILLRGDPLDETIKLPSFKKLDELAVKMFDILETYDYGENNLSAHLLKNYHRYLWKTSIDTLKKQTQVIPCLAGKSHMVIWGDGRVASCEMLPEIGNLKDKSLNKILESKEMKDQIKFIENKKCHCTHNCAMITSVLYNPSKWPKIIYSKKPS